MDKLIVTVAPDAPAAHLARFPDLPRSPEQIADEVLRAWQAGASIAHLHVLDEQGCPTQDLAAFKRTLDLIRARCDILIEGSTGGLTGFSAADRCVALQAGVNLASLNPGSVNYDQGVYVNSPQDIDYWVREMRRRQVKPAIAVFEAGMIANAMSYAQPGLLTLPPFFNFVLGQRGAMPATARNLLFLVESLPQGALWEVTGHTGHDLEAALWALALGGHARAGFEDNIYYGPGIRAASNASLVERVVRMAHETGRDVASPAEARSLLHLAPTTRPEFEAAPGLIPQGASEL